MITNIILLEATVAIIGAVFLGPQAIEDSHEPWLSLWWEWAGQHLDNDFPAVWDGCNYNYCHPEGWYTLEFEEWLEEKGFDTSKKEIYLGLSNLENYLVKHKYIKRVYYWTYMYKINREKLI